MNFFATSTYGGVIKPFHTVTGRLCVYLGPDLVLQTIWSDILVKCKSTKKSGKRNGPFGFEFEDNHLGMLCPGCRRPIIIMHRFY